MPPTRDDSHVLDFLRQAEQAAPAPAAPAVSAAARGTWHGDRQRLKAHYDAAATTDENQRHWQRADFFSARAAGNIAVRRLLRNRSRYEFANNSYYQGMVLTLASHTVGRGPRLRVMTPDKELNQAIELQFALWARAAGLAEKLRTMRMTRCIDGEVFASFFTNPTVLHPVKLDLHLYEGDQFATPTLLTPLPTQVDGIEFDELGNPAFYHRLKQHPGDFYFIKDPFHFDRLPASEVLHLFRPDRPNQARGIPEMAPSLPLFAMLRRFALATVAAAETAADFAAVMHTIAGANREAEELAEDEWFQAIPLEYRAMLTLPAGWTIDQLKAEHPNSTIEMFVRIILREIARCICMPFNICAGDSASYNYSSGRLDHLTYWRANQIDQSYQERAALDRILAAWLDEALLVYGLLPDGLGVFDALPHQWMWDGNDDIDPQKTAEANKTKLGTGTTSRDRLYAEDGLDVDEEDERAAASFGVTVEEYRAALFKATFTSGSAPAPAPAAEEQSTEAEKPTPDQADQAQALLRIAARQGELLTASAELDLCGSEQTAETRIEFTAAANADGSPNASPRFSMLAYTGGRLNVPIRPYPVIVDLATLTAPQTVPVLRDHKLSAIVGHTDSIDKSLGAIRVSGVASGSDSHVDDVVGTSRRGFPWQASIGLHLAGGTVFYARGEKVTVNGRTFDGPVYVAMNSVLKEISFVASGADEGGATARIAAASISDPPHQSHPAKEIPMKTFAEWLQAKGFSLEKLEGPQKESLQAMYDAELAASRTPIAAIVPPPVAAEAPIPANANLLTASAQADEAIRAYRTRLGSEQARIDRIGEICRQHPQATGLQARAINEGWDADRTNLEAQVLTLRAGRPSPTSGHPGLAADQAPRHAEILQASMLMASGRMNETQCGKLFHQDVMTEALSRRHRGATLHAAIDFCLHSAGKSWHGSRKSDDFIRASFEADTMLRASDGFTTLSLSNILENAAGKMLLTAYQAIEVVWSYFCAIRSHTDFKVHSRYRLDSTGAFKKVGPDGELKMMGLSDAKYSSQLDTYGTLLTLNRQMYYNDDLGSFMELPEFLGTLAATRTEEGFWVLLLSNPVVGSNNFFSAGNGNYITGAGTALSTAALDTARQNFRNRITPAGKPMLISPSRMLVGTTLETVANQLWASEKLMVTTTTDTPKFNDNPFKGLYRPYISPYSNNTAILDEGGIALAAQSNTQWWLFADPAVRAAVGAAFLNGNQVPTLQFAEANFNVLGMQWRCFSDFAFGLEDPNGALLSTGAA
jgi:lambda family phage portal protein